MTAVEWGSRNQQPMAEGARIGWANRKAARCSQQGLPAWHAELPQPGIKPAPLQWKRGVLTTGLPGKSEASPIFKLLRSPGQCSYPRPHIPKPPPSQALTSPSGPSPSGISVSCASTSALRGGGLLAGPQAPAPRHAQVWVEHCGLI